ncbi:MAG: transposase, partial [Microcoleus sp.]
MPPLFHSVAEPIGIDLGLSTFATISDGNFSDFPPGLKQAKTKLSQEQWRNLKKQLGNRQLGVIVANNAQKHSRIIAKINAKDANQLRYLLPKNTTETIHKYAHICLEYLKVSGMVANHKLAAAIAVLNLGEVCPMPYALCPMPYALYQACTALLLRNAIFQIMVA